MKIFTSFFSSLLALHLSAVTAASQLPVVDLGYTVQQATLNVSILLFPLEYQLYFVAAAGIVWIWMPCLVT
jgi:hypothetical protein